MVTQPAYAQYPGCNGHGSESPQITGSGNDLSVTWLYEEPCGGDHVYMTSSLDGGTTFGNKIDLSKNNTVPFFSGTRVILGNNVYYAWMNHTIPNTNEIFFSKSTDGGITFGDTSKVASYDAYFNEVAELDKMIVSGNNVFVVWSTNRDIGNGNTGTIYLSKSTDGGITFANPVPINRPSTNWNGLESVTSDNMTYFLWQSVVNGTCILGSCDSQVHVRSIDASGNLGETHNPFILSKASQVKIAASGNNVYITGILFKPNLPNNGTGIQVYTPTASPQWVFFSKSTDRGTTFGNMLNLSGSSFYCMPNGVSYYQCNLSKVNAYTSDTGVYITWNNSNYATNANEEFFVDSMDSGNTFGKVVQLNPYDLDNIICDFSEQCVAVLAPRESNGTVYLAWAADTISSGQIHFIFAKSVDGGNTFDYTDTSNATQMNSQPVLYLASGTIYIAGVKFGFSDGNHIFFSKSTDGGSTFSNGIDLDTQKQVSIPEFPFAIPVLLIGVVSVIGFYRMRSEK